MEGIAGIDRTSNRDPVARMIGKLMPCWGMHDPLLGAGGAIAWALPNVQTAQDSDEAQGDPHLRSAKEVIDYRIQAVEGPAGHVDDFVVSGESWVIRYIIVDTGGWLLAEKYNSRRKGSAK